MSSELRTILAWVLAIAAMVCVELSVSYLGAKIGVPTLSGTGAEGTSLRVLVFSFLVAVAIWHLVAGRQFTPKGRAGYLGFLVFIAILIVGGIPIWKLFHGSLVGNLFDVGLFGVAFLFGFSVNDDLQKSDSTLYARVDRVWPVRDVR